MSISRRRVLSALICAILILSLCGNGYADQAGAASPGILFGEEFWELYNLQSIEAQTGSYAAVGEKLYKLTGLGEIYSYDFQKHEYALLTTVPAFGRTGEKKYSDQDPAVRKQVEAAVFQIVGALDSDVLYGYNPGSGLFGTIDAEGIHWQDVRLDNAMALEYSDMQGLVLPCSLDTPFVEGDTLYGYRASNMWTENGSQPIDGKLCSYDLHTGACTVTDLPGTYAICPYKSGWILLLRRLENGRMVLTEFDLSAKAFGEEIPLSITTDSTDYLDVGDMISGVAYHEATNTFIYDSQGKLWESVGGQEFHEMPVTMPDKFEYINLAGSWTWIMPDGSYLCPFSLYCLVV